MCVISVCVCVCVLGTVSLWSLPLDLSETRNKEIRKYLLSWSGIGKDRLDRRKGMGYREFREKEAGRRVDVLAFFLSL